MSIFFYKYFIIIFNRLFDANTSISDEMARSIAINPQKIVCLTTSNLIFSLLLSFIMDLYSLNPLTHIASMAGINIKFCNTKLAKTKASPFDVPSTLIQAEIVYPRQNPLYTTIPKTTGIPYNCCTKKP